MFSYHSQKDATEPKAAWAGRISEKFFTRFRASIVTFKRTLPRPFGRREGGTVAEFVLCISGDHFVAERAQATSHRLAGIVGDSSRLLIEYCPPLHLTLLMLPRKTHTFLTAVNLNQSPNRPRFLYCLVRCGDASVLWHPPPTSDL